MRAPSLTRARSTHFPMIPASRNGNPSALSGRNSGSDERGPALCRVDTRGTSDANALIKTTRSAHDKGQGIVAHGRPRARVSTRMSRLRLVELAAAGLMAGCAVRPTTAAVIEPLPQPQPATTAARIASPVHHHDEPVTPEAKTACAGKLACAGKASCSGAGIPSRLLESRDYGSLCRLPRSRRNAIALPFLCKGLRWTVARRCVRVGLSAR